LNKKTVQIKHGGNLLFAAVPLKKAHFIKPSEIQRTAALIFSKPPFRNSALLWHSFTPPNNGFFLFRLRGGFFCHILL